jgi:hypothetical protein
MPSGEIHFLASLALTWGIGLTPPMVIRYVLLRRPIDKWVAAGVCTVFWLVNFVVFAALGSQSKTHFALILVFFASHWILRDGSIFETRKAHAAQDSAPVQPTLYPLLRVGPGSYHCGRCSYRIDESSREWDVLRASRRCPSCAHSVSFD